MKKILFPLADKEYTVLERMHLLLRSLSRNFIVEVLTASKDVHEGISKKLVDCQNIILTLVEPKYLPFNFGFRDDLAKIFIQYTDNICIPNTDLKLWKTAAFDDFWGHLSNISFPEIRGIDADIVLMPLISFEDNPWEEADVFYTTVAFMAKNAGVKIIGYQVYPVFNCLKLMPRLMDAIIVREEYEREFYSDIGIPTEKIHLVTDEKDIYLFSTIEDAYKNHLYNTHIDIGRDELGVLVINHQKYRPQIKEIFNAIGQSGVATVLSLLKRDYHVREVTEDHIMEKLYFDDIRKITDRFYLIESQSVVPIIMLSDVIISPAYVAPIEFASRYRKRAFVYNPLYGSRPDINGVKFVNMQTELTALLKTAYSEKRESVSMTNILKLLMEDDHEVKR
ncbi:MAG TPA: hypothetical protein DDX84_07910 [Nitrospiraceae bacterium]|nr:MAG: hypothetical protein A2035_07445 [Nitrospirae bacterium GWA2_42_11]HBI24107.1 hypothetical protein [Nitrospiraceae bacterium]